MKLETKINKILQIENLESRKNQLTILAFKLMPQSNQQIKVIKLINEIKL